MLATDKGKSGWEWQTTIFKHQGFPVEYIWMIQIIRSNSSKKVESPVSFFWGGGWHLETFHVGTYMFKIIQGKSMICSFIYMHLYLYILYYIYILYIPQTQSFLSNLNWSCRPFCYATLWSSRSPRSSIKIFIPVIAPWYGRVEPSRGTSWHQWRSFQPFVGGPFRRFSGLVWLQVKQGIFQELPIDIESQQQQQQQHSTPPQTSTQQTWIR